MDTATPPTKLYTALLAAMRAAGPVVKNATNPHLKSKYADLSAVLEAIEQPLWDNGLIVVQRFDHDQGGPILVTELIHAESGQSIASALPIVCKDPTDPQKLGGAITYARRYSLLALLGLSPEDDDGHSASQPARQTRTPNTPTTPRPAGQPPAPAGTPYLPSEFERALDGLWAMAEDGKPLDAIKRRVNEHWPRLDTAQREEALAAVAKITAQHYTPAGAAG